MSEAFVSTPSKLFYQGDCLDLQYDLTALTHSKDRYLLQIGMTYSDLRTGETHSEGYWRQFYYQTLEDDGP